MSALAVSGNGAYDTKDCHEAIALRAVHAIIPTRKNAKPWKANRCGRHPAHNAQAGPGNLEKVEWLLPPQPC
jgi:hypothetical protein